VSWFKRSKKNESASPKDVKELWDESLLRAENSAMHKLATKVFEKSLLCAETLKPDLEGRFGKGSKEFQSKYFPVLFEFMYFFLHLVNRDAFAQLGHLRRNKLYDELVPGAVDAMIETYFGHWSENLKDG